MYSWCSRPGDARRRARGEAPAVEGEEFVVAVVGAVEGVTLLRPAGDAGRHLAQVAVDGQDEARRTPGIVPAMSRQASDQRPRTTRAATQRRQGREQLGPSGASGERDTRRRPRRHPDR